MNRPTFQALRGTKDVLPKEVWLWQDLEQKARAFFARYNYKEIRTPILEEFGLFVRSVGKTTEIVQKQMYSFMDQGKRKLCLRPEATAACVRAYLEHHLHLNEPVSKFYYLGPMFRAERPQSGRLRQFHQIGVEVMGRDSYLLDTEVICLLINLVKEFGLNQFQLKINTLGCLRDKEDMAKEYKKLLKRKKAILCGTCQKRLETNVWRILDCKNLVCQKMIKALPSTLGLICADCKNHFEKLLHMLDITKITYEVDPHIVRGLDYYTRTVFELISSALGSQDALAAGGRYDHLIESLGGPAIGAIGFALGLERLILALEKTMHLKEWGQPLSVFLITLGEEADRVGFLLLEQLREKRVHCDMDYTDKSLKAKLRRADKLKAKFVLIIGEDELKKGEYILRDMSSSQQTSIKKEDIIEELIKRLTKV